MKNVFAAFLLVFCLQSAVAQKAEWHTDLSKAVQLSESSKKPLLLFFTGSDWCGWCIRLQKEVLLTDEFSAWAKENVVLLELDFPRRSPQAEALRKQNMELQQFFQIRGYPTVWLVNAKADKTGKVSFEQLGSTGYVAGGPQPWLSQANRILKKT